MSNLAPAMQYSTEPTLVLCPHPLSAAIGREISYCAFMPGETVLAFLRRSGINLRRNNWALFVNDERVPRTAWESRILKTSDLITMRAIVADGGSGDKNKGIRTILTIAALVIAQQYEGAARYAIAALGSYAAARLFPPVLPPMEKLRGDDASPTYSLSGGSNQARPFQPMAATLGIHRQWPDLGANTYTEFVGDDQYLYQVFHFGLTDIALTDFKIGDTPLDDYDDVEYELSDETGELSLFPANVDTAAGADLVNSAGWIERTSSEDATALAVEVSGYLFLSGDDGMEPRSVTLGVEYKAVGAPDWDNFVFGGEVTITNSSRKPVRWGHRINVSSGQYSIRMRRVTADETNERATSELTWTQLRTYQPDTADYTGQLRMALKIRANEQLQGQIDIFNAMASLSAPMWDGFSWATEPTNNAGAMFLYWARGKFNGSRRLFGGGLDDSELDIDGIKDWILFCEDKGLTCNLVFDRKMTVEDQLIIIARCGRGVPTWSAGVLGVVWDEGGQPAVAHFGMSNIRRRSFRVDYNSTRPVDEVVVNFVNPALGYKPDTVRALVPGVVDPVNELTVEIMGCTDPVMAGKEANLEAAAFVHRTRVITWETDMEGLVVRRGDVVTLSHDLTQWGYSGRLVAGSADGVQLDRAVPFTPGYDHYIGIRYPNGNYDIYPVQYFAGETDLLSLPEKLVKDPWTASTEMEEGDQRQPTVFNGFYYEATVAGETGSTEPDPWPLTEGDTVEDGGVTWRNAGPANAWAPDDDPNGHPALDYMYWFDPQFTPGKKVKIMDFQPLSMNHVRLVATDEADDYYLSEDDSYTYLPPSTANNTPTISNLSISDTLIRAGNVYQVRMALAWDVSGDYGGAIIRAAATGEALQIVDRTFGRRSEFTWHPFGSMQVEVTVLNRAGEYSAAGVSGPHTYTIQGQAKPPADVAGFTSVLRDYRILLSWDHVPDADFLDYELRQGADWDTAEYVDRVDTNSLSLDIREEGSYQFLIKARDTTRNVSENAESTTIVVDLPDAPVISNRFEGGNAVLEWTTPSSSFPIAEFEIRYGDEYETSTFVTRIRASSFSLPAAWSGIRRFWVSAVDAAENLGAAGSQDVVVITPSAPVLSRRVIDNYVLLSWTLSPGTLPIGTTEIRRGTTFAGAEVIGDTSGTFTTVFESSADTYTYWAVHKDVATNYGAEASVVAIVNAPPDFVLREDWFSDFSGAKTNAYITQSGRLLLPVNTTETWAEHFSNNSWDDPQDQIAAGYPYYAMPSDDSAVYEEVFDYGTVLEGTLITVIANEQGIAGSVSVVNTISVRADPGDAWTDYAGVDQAYASDFRYVKVRREYTAAGGDDLLEVLQLNVQLSVKQITDEGRATANAGDASGTFVAFNKTFVAAEAVTITPIGTTPIIEVATGYDTPNPTGFYVRLFDNSGTRVTADFGWNARGN